MSATVKQLMYKANIVVQGHGKYGPEADLRIPPAKKLWSKTWRHSHKTSPTHIQQVLRIGHGQAKSVKFSTMIIRFIFKQVQILQPRVCQSERALPTQI